MPGPCESAETVRRAVRDGRGSEGPLYGTGGFAYPPRMNSTAKNRSRALMWWGAAALTLLAGYIDLARGGETIAPILLIIGYVVLVPAAIIKG